MATSSPTWPGPWRTPGSTWAGRTHTADWRGARRPSAEELPARDGAGGPRGLFRAGTIGRGAEFEPGTDDAGKLRGALRGERCAADGADTPPRAGRGVREQGRRARGRLRPGALPYL